MNSQPSVQRRRPPSKRQVTPEVYELLKRTHRVLKSNGVRVKADLWNPRGDGRTWIFIFEPADKMPQSGDPIDLVRRVLEAEGVEVLSVQKRENGTFGVAVCPSARGSSAAESPRSSQDSISELLREFDGLDPSFLTTPIPLNATKGSRHKLTPVTLEPPLEEMIGTALKQVRESFAGHVPVTLPLKTMPPEKGITSAPLQSQTDDERLGEQFAVLNGELKSISKIAKGKRRYSEEDARQDFPDFYLWAVINNSNIDQRSRSDWFATSYQRFGEREGRFDFIGELTGRSSATAYDIYKRRPSRKKRSLQ